MQDRQIKQQLEERVVVINEVNLPKIIAIDQFNTTLYISLQFVDPVFVVPEVGETWTVKRSGGDWFLNRRLNKVGFDHSEGDVVIDGKTVKLNGQISLEITGEPDDASLDYLSAKIWFDGSTINIKSKDINGVVSSAVLNNPIGVSASGTAHIIENDGTPLIARDELNFTGAGVEVMDLDGKIVVQIAGGGDDSNSVHISGIETITGDKDFTGAITHNASALVDTTDSRLTNTRTPTDNTVTSAKIVDGAIVNADINGSAAIAYSKLNLGTSIVNADVDTSAAIALSKLADPGAGNVITSTGSGAIATKPPGYELAYFEITSPLTTTQTVQASATTWLTAPSVTFDGSTTVIIAISFPYVQPSGTYGVRINLWEDSTDLGGLCLVFNTSYYTPVYRDLRRTPSAGAKVYTARAYLTTTGTGTGGAGTVGSVYTPAYIRITKV